MSVGLPEEKIKPDGIVGICKARSMINFWDFRKNTYLSD